MEYFPLGVVAVGRANLALNYLVVFAVCAAMNLGSLTDVAFVGNGLPRFTGLGRSDPPVGGPLLFVASIEASVLSLTVCLRVISRDVPPAEKMSHAAKPRNGGVGISLLTTVSIGIEARFLLSGITWFVSSTFNERVL